MANEEKTTSRSGRRSVAQLATDLKAAIDKEVTENGYMKTSLNAALAESKISPVTFASHYGSLEEYFSTYASKEDFWLSEVLPKIKPGDPASKKITEALLNILWKLNKQTDLTIGQLLKWEVAESNPTTTRSGLVRQLQTLRWLKTLQEIGKTPSDFDYEALMALLSGGIYYLSLHRDASPVCGIDLNTRDGCERIDKMVRRILKTVLQEKKAPRKSEKIIVNSE